MIESDTSDALYFMLDICDFDLGVQDNLLQQEEIAFPMIARLLRTTALAGVGRPRVGLFQVVRPG